jgi:cystathionine gamma-synthase
VQHTPVHLADLDAARAAVRPGHTRLVWVETPTNPLLAVADLAALAQLAHEAGALLAVDNTFATPYLQCPLALGADVVVHSTTKYCGGHSDVIGGALVVDSRAEAPWMDGVGAVGPGLSERVGFHQNAMGAVAGPFDAWLVQRGLKTLAVRMERHCDNAERVAEYLLAHRRVRQVLYPGLPEHPGHDVAQKQMRRFGGMVSFRVVGGEQEALEVCDRTEVFTLGESLGGVESLVEHPARMTHASVAGSALEVPADLIRLSVGIEDADDLLADLDRALA